MTRKRRLVGALAFAGASLFSQAALADYLCEADFYPNETLGFGNSGRIRFTTSSGPNCSGTFTGVWYFCTTGATASQCIANTAFHYTASEFLALVTHVREGLTWGLRTSVFMSACIGAGSCAAYISYSAN